MHALLITALFLPLAGCSLLGLDRGNADGEGTGSDYEDVYRYTAYDGDGETVVTGTLYLVHVPSDVMDEPDRLQGRWELEATAENIGPQDGEGTLNGTVEDGAFAINLNPEMADDNVFLQGRFEDDRARMVGLWSHTTFIGPAAGGTFEAERTRRATQHHVGG